MINLVSGLLHARLTTLRERLVEDTNSSSPDAGFARFAFEAVGAVSPIAPPKLPDIESLRRGWAPYLAVAGYQLHAQNTRVRRAWCEGFDRLAGSDPFPADRVSFAYRPTEIIGLTLGVQNASDSTESGPEWLYNVIRRRCSDERTSSWPGVLYLIAAKIADLDASAGLLHEGQLDLLSFQRWWLEWQGGQESPEEQKKADEEVLNRLAGQGAEILEVPRAAIILQVAEAAVRRRISWVVSRGEERPGLEESARQSSEALPWNVNTQRPDVAVLVVLKDEFRELRRELSERWHPLKNERYGGFDYIWVDAVSDYRCVATFSGRMSPEEAVHYTNRLLEWQPSTIVNIGIAAGLHSDLRIGDVVAPDVVVAYDKTSKVRPVKDAEGKELPDDWEVEPRSDAFRPSHELVELMKHLDTARPKEFSRWQKRGAEEFSTIREGNREVIDALLRRKKEPVLRERPEILVETLASGHSVAAAPAFTNRVRATNGDIKALEMEAAGMLLAAGKQVGKFNTLVLRGISDHSAVPKEDTEEIDSGALRGLAMRNAWRVFELLLELQWLPRNPHGS